MQHNSPPTRTAVAMMIQSGDNQVKLHSGHQSYFFALQPYQHFFQLVPTTESNFADKLVILISYIASVKWANRLAVVHVSLAVGTSIFLMVVWGASVGLFNMHKSMSGSTDIWSWSCQVAKEDGAVYAGVNWAQFCKEQVSQLLRFVLMNRLGARSADCCQLHLNY